MEHNPSQLTPQQYGRDQGYRLLEVDEITAEGASIEEIESLCPDETWIVGTYGAFEELTYRTRLSRCALAAARGLTPASEPEKADAFDAWMKTEEAQDATSNGSMNSSLRAAFLAGQCSERNRAKEVEEILRRWLIGGECFCSEFTADRGMCSFCETRAFLASREPKGDQPL